jgi:DNA-binding winged helix-turn-helix (wHTH) protein
VATTQINLADMPDFDLGGLRVSPAHRLVGENGHQKELEPKIIQVLVAIASARPEEVSRDRPIQHCWNGRTVGDDALNRCIVALRQQAREFSPSPLPSKTVLRVGYSLVERSDCAASASARKRSTGAGPAAGQR